MQDVNMELKALEIFYRANGAAVEGIADRNGHRRRVLGDGKKFSWIVARKKCKRQNFDLTKICSCTVIC